MKVTFYYVRHGKTLFNEMGRMQGMCDSPLLKEGILGAENTASALSKVKFASCYSSSSQRAWDTAEIICRPHGLNPILMKELREFDFGELDGEYLKDVKKEKGNYFTREDWSEYGGDTMSSFAERSKRAFDQMIQESNDGDNVLVVGHGAYIMHLMETLLYFDRDSYIDECNKTGRVWMPNCGICIFSWEDGIWKMEQTPLSGDEYRLLYGTKKLNFTYVRHGETHFNSTHRMQGRCDSPLTEKGRHQAEKVGQKLKDTHFDRVYVSTSERTRDTADILLEGHDISYITDKRLQEVFFGTLEGEKNPLENPEYKENFDHVMFSEYGGENFEDVADRLQHFLNSVIDSCDENDSVLLVSHGMLYFVLLRSVFHVDMEKYMEECRTENKNPIPNCGVCRFEYDHGTFTMIERMEKTWQEN